MCKHHHTLVHDRGYLIAARPDGTFAFHRPDGTPIPSSPALPDVEGTIEGCHEADITPDTIIPPWYGERLDLDHAIYICLANARTEEERRAGRDQAEPTVPDRVQVFEPEGWADRIRQYYAEHAAYRRHGRSCVRPSAGVSTFVPKAGPLPTVDNPLPCPASRTCRTRRNQESLIQGGPSIPQAAEYLASR